MDIATYKPKIVAILTALFPHAKVILYGSRARGTQREFSDIDLALDAGQRLPRLDVQEAVDMFRESNIPYTIEIVDFHAVTPTMQENIKREGIV